jgi:hypothetical protein
LLLRNNNRDCGKIPFFKKTISFPLAFLLIVKEQYSGIAIIFMAVYVVSEVIKFKLVSILFSFSKNKQLQLLQQPKPQKKRRRNGRAEVCAFIVFILLPTYFP